MKFDITSFQTLAANLPVEGEVCDLAHAEVSTQSETDTEIAPLIQQVGARSIAEIDLLIAELQEVKTHLQSALHAAWQRMISQLQVPDLALSGLFSGFGDCAVLQNASCVSLDEVRARVV
jgi:hypothetical protein